MIVDAALLFMIVLLFILVAGGYYFIVRPAALFIQAQTSGVELPFFHIVFMMFRNLPAGLIVENLIALRTAGIRNVTVEELEAHHLAGGDIRIVVRAAIAEKALGKEVDFNVIAGKNLAGKL